MKNKNFDLFKKECNKWIKKLELSNYDIEFKYKKDSDFDGPYISTQADYNATIYYQDYLEDNSPANIKAGAKHEIIHLLLGRLSNAAYTRFTTKESVAYAEEEVVRKLAKLL